MSETQHAGDYRLISFVVYSHKHLEPIDIVSHVDELEIFENIELPYLTGTFTMKDDMRFYDGVGINGTEMIEITLESAENTGNQILKRFTIAEVVSTAKSADNIEALEIKIIENSCFNSSIMQINKAYTGTPDVIIKKILSDNLGINVDLPLVKPYQRTKKVVIPYMAPFTACQWILSTMSTDLGLPYFLFATLNDVPERPGVNLQLKSLEEILKNPAWNKNSPYRFSAAYNNSTSALASDKNVFNVGAYSGHHKENVFSLMQSGSTAGSRSISDVTSGQLIDYTFNVDTIFRELSEMAIIDIDHEPVFHSKYEFDGKSMNEYNTFNSHRVVANNTYAGVDNIYEENSTAQFKLHASKRALMNMLHKGSINIRVPGILYLIGTNASLGRQIDFIYPANNTNTISQSSVSDEDQIDKKRSGTYIIYTARHSFNATQHNVDMTCVKLGNRK